MQVGPGVGGRYAYYRLKAKKRMFSSLTSSESRGRWLLKMRKPQLMSCIAEKVSFVDVILKMSGFGLLQDFVVSG